MLVFSNGTNVNTIAKNTLSYFTLTVIDEPVKDWDLERVRGIFSQVTTRCGEKNSVVIIDFDKGLTANEFKHISRLIMEETLTATGMIRLIVSPTAAKSSKQPRTAQNFIQSLFQNDKCMARMVREYSSGYHQITKDKGQLIALFLKFVESQGLEMNELEIMSIFKEFSSLRQIALAMRK